MAKVVKHDQRNILKKIFSSHRTPILTYDVIYGRNFEDFW